MLQQTQVERVMPKYLKFISLFPTVQKLAAASVSEVLTAWQGLGYNRRAIALHDCAIEVQNTYRGVVPSRVEDLVMLPGIGRATASAIMVYAYNAPEVFIETNVRRVFIHFFFQDRDTVHDGAIEPLVRASLWRENPRDWYNSLMDYGSLLKTRVPNPNRRSVHHHPPTCFLGSDRQLRGLILRKLLAEGEMTENALATELKVDCSKVLPILMAMQRDGLITTDATVWKV